MSKRRIDLRYEAFDIQRIGQADFDRRIGRGAVPISYMDNSSGRARIVREHPDSSRVFMDVVDGEELEIVAND